MADYESFESAYIKAEDYIKDVAKVKEVKKQVETSHEKQKCSFNSLNKVIIFIVNKKTTEHRLEECAKYIDSLNPSLVCIYALNYEHIFKKYNWQKAFLQIPFMNFDEIKNRLILLARKEILKRYISQVQTIFTPYLPADIVKFELSPLLSANSNNFLDWVALVFNSKEDLTIDDTNTVIYHDVYYARRNSARNKQYNSPILFRLFKPLLFIKDRPISRSSLYQCTFSMENLTNMPLDCVHNFNKEFEKYLDTRLNVKSKDWIMMSKKYKREYIPGSNVIANISSHDEEPW